MNPSPLSQSFTSRPFPRGTFDTNRAATLGSRRVAADGHPPLPRDHRLVDEGKTTVRRALASDAEAFQDFIAGLSAASRRMRFHGVVNACTPALLRYLTQVDNVRHHAWFAFEHRHGDEVLVGEARFVTAVGGHMAEFAIAIADDQQGRGVADRLLQTLVAAASQARVGVLFGDVLGSNARMSGFLRRHRFEIDPFADVDAGIARWHRRLSAADPSLARQQTKSDR